MADRTLLQQVILNLIKNAIEAMATGPTAVKTLRLVTTQNANAVVALFCPGLRTRYNSRKREPTYLIDFLRRNLPERDWDFPSLKGSSRITAVICGLPRPVQMAVLLKSFCQALQRATVVVSDGQLAAVEPTDKSTALPNEQGD